MDTPLPDGWTAATLGELATRAGLFADGDWVESKDQNPNGDCRLIQLADVGDGLYTSKSRRFLTSRKAAELRCTFLKHGDVLIARMPDPLGRACIFPGDEKPSVTVVDVCVFRTARSDVDHRWVMYALNAPQMRVAVASLQSGSTRKRISRKNLGTISLPLPPLPEQHRIVAAIETHLTRLDAAVAALERARARLKRYRAAVLKAACEGRLVPTESCAAWETNWTWTTIGALLADSPQNGIYKPSSSYGEGESIVRIDDFQDGWTRPRVELRRLQLSDGEATAYGIQTGDVLVNRVNSPSHLGKSLVAPASLAGAVFESNMMRLRFGPNVLPGWIGVYLRSSNGKSGLTQNAKHAVNQSSINQTDVRSTQLPLPPLAEQERIVAEVERRLSVLDQLDAAVAANLKRANALRQSILGTAFTGCLVGAPQAKVEGRTP